MTRMAVGASLLLHLRLEHVTFSVLQGVSDRALFLAERGPIVVVEIFDDLKRPSTRENVAPDQLRGQTVCMFGMPATAQLLHCLVEKQVCVPDQLVQLVKVPSRPLDVLECLGHLPDGGDRVVVRALGAKVVFVRSICRFAHRFGVSRSPCEQTASETSRRVWLWLILIYGAVGATGKALLMTIDNAQPSSLVVLVTRKGSTTVVSVRGVVDLQTAPQLTESIDAVLAENVPTTLIVDLTDVSFLASVGMTVLIEVSRRVADTANFAVVADGPSTKRPMTLMGIDQMITVYTDLDAALAAVPSSGE